MKITISAKFKVYDGEVIRQFVISVEKNNRVLSKSVPYERLEGHDALAVMAGNGIMKAGNTEWTNDKTFGKLSEYSSIEEYDDDEWADEYNKRIRKAIESLIDLLEQGDVVDKNMVIDQLKKNADVPKTYLINIWKLLCDIGAIKDAETIESIIENLKQWQHEETKI